MSVTFLMFSVLLIFSISIFFIIWIPSLYWSGMPFPVETTVLTIVMLNALLEHLRCVWDALFLFVFFLCIWVLGLCVCLCTMCVSCACGGQKIPWTWNNWWLWAFIWCWELNLSCLSSARVEVILTSEPSTQLYLSYFWWLLYFQFL